MEANGIKFILRALWGLGIKHTIPEEEIADVVSYINLESRLSVIDDDPEYAPLSETTYAEMIQEMANQNWHEKAFKKRQSESLKPSNDNNISRG